MRDAPPELGIVIPTLNEEEALPALLADLAHLPVPARIVVADGGSGDRTIERARAGGARVVVSERGRATQMNAGARTLGAPWLLFLHADSRLPPETRRAIAGWLAAPPPEEAAHFRFRLDAEGLRWRIIEGGQRLRERLTGLAYGDQGLLVSRRRWEALGGFPPLPLMEDVEAVRRLRGEGGLRRIDAPVVTSARRYREEGALRGWLRNALSMALYGAGIAPERLAPWYRPRGGGSTPPARPPVVLVFAKAPRAGEVKTRLAVDLGEREAARVYREIGREVVERLRGGPYRLVVQFAPPGAETELRDWLGEGGVEFRPQRGRGLGERMRRAFDEAFDEADRVCIVGTDSPALGPDRVARALALVAEPNGADAVFGPAVDGGYYLLALRRPAPELFRAIPWSTDRVLELSMARARELGLEVRTLDTLADVDRLEDVPRDLLPEPEHPRM